MRHPYYSGRKAELVPSVGSRLAGVVKPSYGKPKLKTEGIPAMQSIAFPNVPNLPKHALTAKSPYRLNRETTIAVSERAILLRQYHRNKRKFSAMPRLIKPA